MRRISIFQACRSARLFGRAYREGDSAYLVFLGQDESAWLDAHMGKHGPWGWGGFRSRDIQQAYRPATDRDWWECIEGE